MAHANKTLATCAFLLGIFAQLAKADLNLELVQVLFRHGERTPRAVEMYPNDPYNESTYDPFGLGQLTNVGKMREYRIGEMLRNRYNEFLGDVYRPADLYAVSTDVDRTKMSLLLVLASLYPATAAQAWNKNLSWLPIPIHYAPERIDVVLKPQLCPKYEDIVEETRKTEEVQKKVAVHKEFTRFMSKRTGINDISTSKMYEVYNLLTAQKNMNLTLPDWCTEEVYQKIQDIVKLEYEIRSYTTELKRINGGMMIKKFIENMNAEGKKDNPRKMYLYSAHEVNIVAFAKAHNLTEPKLPDYGSAILVEKLKDENGKLFVRMLLWTGVTEKLIPYELPGCGKVCPIETYLNATQDVIPSEEEVNCLWDTISKDEIQNLFEEKIDPN